MTCKTLVTQWCDANLNGLIEVFRQSGEKLTNDKIADYAFQAIGQQGYSWETVKKWVTIYRRGELTDQISRNIQVAHEAFRPVMTEVDTNPLGVLSDTDDIKNIFFDIPETYASHSAPVIIKDVKLLGVVSDIHFPLHDRPAVLACFSKLKELNIDGLYLNGDIADCGSITHHARRKVINYTWDQELTVLKAFIHSLRVLFPKIPIWYKEGNHEDWLPRYLARVAPELGNQYGLRTALEFEKYNITPVDSHQVARFGRLWIAHGHEIGLKGGTLNIARQVLMRTNVNTLVGHWHKNDQHERRNLDESVVSAWVTGCLSDLHPDYAPANQMTHGFATVEMLSDDGAFTVRPYKILSGRVIG